MFPVIAITLTQIDVEQKLLHSSCNYDERFQPLHGSFSGSIFLLIMEYYAT